MIINHNLSSLNTYKKYSSSNNKVSKSLEKLSSGLAINQASDNAAGLAISEKMRGQIRGLDQASTNGTNTISLIQTAEGALNETHSILQRIRELSVQAANDTNTDSDRNEIQKEVDQLISSIDNISTNTEFNTKKLLDGSLIYQAGSPEILSTSSFDVQGYETGHILADGWFTYPNGAKIKLNASEDLVYPSGIDKIYISIRQVNYSPVGFQITLEGGDVLFENNYDSVDSPTILSYSGYGFTVDVSQYSNSSVNGGQFTLQYVLLHEGNNGSPAIPAIDNLLITQIGANTNQTIKLGINDMGAASLGIDSLDLTTQSNAESAISTVDSAIDLVSSERAKLGAFQNRLEHAVSVNNTSSENLTSSESRIRDVDMASEMMNYTKETIILQAAQSMLAQSNQQPESILQLLQ